MNYDAEAKRIANLIHLRGAEVHRGATPSVEPGVSVAFGNDNYAGDPRTRELVRRLFQVAYENNIEVVGFATNDAQPDAGCCWVMLVRTDDLDWVKARLHDAFIESHQLDGLPAETNV